MGYYCIIYLVLRSNYELLKTKIFNQNIKLNLFTGHF